MLLSADFGCDAEQIPSSGLTERCEFQSVDHPVRIWILPLERIKNIARVCIAPRDFSTGSLPRSGIEEIAVPDIFFEHDRLFRFRPIGIMENKTHQFAFRGEHDTVQNIHKLTKELADSHPDTLNIEYEEADTQIEEIFRNDTEEQS